MGEPKTVRATPLSGSNLIVHPTAGNASLVLYVLEQVQSAAETGDRALTAYPLFYTILFLLVLALSTLFAVGMRRAWDKLYRQ